MIEPVAVAFAMLGSLMVSSKNRRMRRLAFAIWCGTNSSFFVLTVTDGRYYMATMYVFFLLTCLRGIWNNREA